MTPNCKTETDRAKLKLKVDTLTQRINDNPPIELSKESYNLYAKLEFFSFMGSIKDRPALYIIKDAIEKGLINQDSTIIESSSGNFALALAGICKVLDIKFIPVVDVNVLMEKEQLLKILCQNVVKVTDIDESGGYLLTRIREVKRLLGEIPNSYNPNQYENKNNYLAYYHTLGQEIYDHFERLDYLFVSVSSGGTITGLSLRLKEKFKNLKVIAVDVKGSLIFSDEKNKRNIPGMGSAFRTSFFDKALIDDFIILSELDIVDGCHELLNDYSLFAGGSSGAAYSAIGKYFADKKITNNPNVLFICPDKGNTYMDTIYNSNWVKKEIKQEEDEVYK